MAEEIKYDLRRGADIYRAIYSSRIRSWILRGVIKRGESLVWRSGLSGWRKPEELEELEPLFERQEKQRLKERKKTKEGISFRRKISNILIIDDEKDLCWLLSNALSRRGYNVAIANTRRESAACLKREPPDLVFLDLRLPDGDGMNVLSKIKKINPETIVNVISAYGSEERREEASRKGAYGFIDKPFTEKDILRTIRAVS